MEDNDFGNCSSVALGIFIIFGLVRMGKNSWKAFKDRKSYWKEEVILDQVPVVFSLSSWLVLWLGTRYASIELAETFYKFIVISGLAGYIFKRICNESPYNYGKLQHQLIRANSISYTIYTFELTSCKQVNSFIKCQIYIITFSCLMCIIKLGLGLNLILSNRSFGSWGMNDWSIIRIVEILTTLILFWNFWVLNQISKKLGLPSDPKVPLTAISILLASLHPLIALLISISHTFNSNDLIIMTSNLFVLVEMIMIMFYYDSLY
jgi:hypothetical protein